MTVTIRPATRADLPIVKVMMGEFTDYLNGLGEPEDIDPALYDRVEEHVFGDAGVCGLLIAEIDDAVAGYLLHHPGIEMDTMTPALHVVDLFARAEHRGAGVGRALMETAADIVRERKGSAVFWTVWDKNPAAMAFYRHLGARPFSEEILMRWDVSAD